MIEVFASSDRRHLSPPADDDARRSASKHRFDYAASTAAFRADEEIFSRQRRCRHRQLPLRLSARLIRLPAWLGAAACRPGIRQYAA